MRSLLLLAGLAASSSALAGEPILIPDFTPATTSEFGLAYMLQERVGLALQEQGHVVLTSDMVRPVVGPATDGCADEATCPYTALKDLPARIAVVVRVVRHEGELLGEVRVYQKGDAKPIEIREVAIEGGREAAFGEAVARIIDDVLSLLGPSHAADLVEAVKLVTAAEDAAEAETSDPDPDPDPDPEPEASPRPDPDPEGDPAADPAADAPLAKLLEGTEVFPRHLVGAERHFRESGLDIRDWIFEQTPHAGRLVVEVRAGVGVGDVDRHADVRVDLDDDSPWFQEGPTYDQAVRGSLYAGWAASTWFETGLLLGLQYGRKGLTYGWVNSPADPAEFTSEASTVQALQIYLQARARFYLAHLGIAKPFVFAAPELRVFDSYKIDSPESVVYPEPAAGAVPGISGGGGLLIDPGPIVGFFAEGSYTRYFGVLSEASEMAGSTRPSGAPAPPEATQQVLGIVGGVQFRL